MPLTFVQLGTDIGDYKRAKSVLDKARHPDFIGPQRFIRAIEKGRIVVANDGERDLGVVMTEGDTLGVLSVVRQAQGKGVGKALVELVRCRFVRAIDNAAGMFEKLGYRRVGAPDVTKKKFVVQLLEKDWAEDEAEAVASYVSAGPPAAESAEEAEHPDCSSFEERFQYLLRLMALKRYEKGSTCEELALVWGVPVSTVQNASALAAHTLRAMEERDVVIDLVRAGTFARLNGAEDGAYVALSRLLIDTVGGFSQKHEVTVEATSAPVEVVAEKALSLAVKVIPDKVLKAAEQIRSSRALLTEGTEK